MVIRWAAEIHESYSLLCSRDKYPVRLPTAEIFDCIWISIRVWIMSQSFGNSRCWNQAQSQARVLHLGFFINLPVGLQKRSQKGGDNLADLIMSRGARLAELRTETGKVRQRFWYC